jgi:enediyne biosynthesis protein E4
MEAALQRLAEGFKMIRPLETSLIPHPFVTFEWIAGLLASRLAVDKLLIYAKGQTTNINKTYYHSKLPMFQTHIKSLSLFLLCILSACTKDKQPTPFTAIPASQTNIHFNNTLTDQPDFNILDYLYFYNGGGVAAGDLNNDGLPDLYFTSNQGSDKIYLNLGNFQFEDISNRFDPAQLEGWSTGVTMADINQDGWLDIYVCQLGNYGPYKNRNLLFINNEGLSFTEAAADYGLDFSGFGTQAAFFDYDQDGDLDCYLLNHSVKSPEQFKPADIRKDKDELAGDVLLEFDNGHYKDVTAQAGIYSSAVGFGLGIAVADVNGDGWPDIYIGNDFHENDYLYINNRNNTFREVIASATGHTSNFSMGVTIDDLNNDALPDILTLDMKPFDEQVYKKSGGWENLEIYNYKRSFGYHHQSPRNALQIQVGRDNGLPIFSERAAFYGLEATDWSWSPLVYDFDNDGDKDIFITNGIARRPNDMDFINFHFDAKEKDKVKQIQQMPKGDVPNCYFENELQTNRFSKRDLFSNSISTGAAVADLDQDGKLDIVINNINAPATILKNTSETPGHYVRVKLRGDGGNRYGLGASVSLYHDGQVQLSHIKTSSGFQSFSEPVAHFGLSQNKIDSIHILWPDGFSQKVVTHKTDTLYTIKKQNTYKSASIPERPKRPLTKIAGYEHREDDFNDQQNEKWLLCGQSSYGPRLEVINQQDIYISGNKRSPSGIIHQSSGTFTPFSDKPIKTDENDACLIGDNLLFVTHGGNQFKSGQVELNDAVYQLHPNNSITKLENAIPDAAFNTSVCQSHDFDKDGDLDIFVGVQSEPGQYGTAPASYLLINSNNPTFVGAGTFTKQDLPLEGMIYDAQWVDLDKNGYADLIIAGHWMPITVLYNDKGQFRKTEIPDSEGLWFSVYCDDVNGDGRIDILAGNYGLNHSLRADAKHPLRLYQNDFDKNGQRESLVTYVVQGREVPYPNQPTFASQVPAIKKNYLKNEAYASAKITELLRPDLLEQAVRKKVVELRTCVFLQKENGNWEKQTLPDELQMAPIFTIEKYATQSFFFGGNYYEVDPNWGRQDAGQLSAFRWHSGQWLNETQKLRLPIVKAPIRDLLFQDKKLYIGGNNWGVGFVDFGVE